MSYPYPKVKGQDDTKIASCMRLFTRCGCLSEGYFLPSSYPASRALRVVSRALDFSQ